MYDEEYFKDRKFEDKHYKEAMIWIDFFNLDEESEFPIRILDYGCGLGFYSHALRYLGIEKVDGFEISEYARNNAYGLMKGHIYTDEADLLSYDFILCYDVLEHIKEEDIPDLLKKLNYYLGPNGEILFSICMQGDPNFIKDKSHIMEKTRIWWEYQINKAGFDIISVPNHFMFRNQLIIGKKS